MRDSDAETAPLLASIDPVETKTGRLPSPARAKRCVPEKLASTMPGCDRSYEPSVPSLTTQCFTLVVQSSEARQLRGTSNFGSMSETAGAFSASRPPPPTQVVGTGVVPASKPFQ